MQIATKTISNIDFMITTNLRLNTIEIIKDNQPLIILDVFDDNIFRYNLKGDAVYFERVNTKTELLITDKDSKRVEVETAEKIITKCIIDKLKEFM